MREIDYEDLSDPCKHDSLRPGSTMTMLMVHDDLYQEDEAECKVLLFVCLFRARRINLSVQR